MDFPDIKPDIKKTLNQLGIFDDSSVRKEKIHKLRKLGKRLVKEKKIEEERIRREKKIEEEINEKIQISIFPKLPEHIENLIKQVVNDVAFTCKNYKLNVKFYHSNDKNFKSNGTTAAGYFTTYDNTIVINLDYANDLPYMTEVLVHELGHLLDYYHNKSDGVTIRRNDIFDTNDYAFTNPRETFAEITTILYNMKSSLGHIGIFEEEYKLYLQCLPKDNFFTRMVAKSFGFDVFDYDILKKRYLELARINHPDVGGDKNTMVLYNNLKDLADIINEVYQGKEKRRVE